ncbi:MAG: hypothetical protein LQ352_007476, partial [Teloschistes flavicans]
MVDEISDGQDSEADKITSAFSASPAAEGNGLMKFPPFKETHSTDRPEHKSSLGRTSSRSALGRDKDAPQASISKHDPRTGDESSGLDRTPEDGLSCSEGQASSSPKDNEVRTSLAHQRAKAEPAFREHLADFSGTSKVTMVYRTNEWAKHLADAEKPTVEDLRAEGST